MISEEIKSSEKQSKKCNQLENLESKFDWKLEKLELLTTNKVDRQIHI